MMAAYILVQLLKNRRSMSQEVTRYLQHHIKPRGVHGDLKRFCADQGCFKCMLRVQGPNLNDATLYSLLHAKMSLSRSKNAYAINKGPGEEFQGRTV